MIFRFPYYKEEKWIRRFYEWQTYLSIVNSFKAKEPGNHQRANGGSHPETRTPLLVDAPLNLHPKIKKENDWHDYKIPVNLADALPTAEEGRPSATEIAVPQPQQA